MSFEIMSGRDQLPVGSYWWVMLADYCCHIAPSITAACRHWYTNDGDGLNAQQSRELAAKLQRSLDDCSIDAYARRRFAALCREQSVPDFVRFEEIDTFCERELPRHQQERRFVNSFVSEIQRFIDFLLASNGFEIL